MQKISASSFPCEEKYIILRFSRLVSVLILQVTTVQLSNTTDRNLANTGLRRDFPNGTLLRTLEQQQEKGMGRTISRA